MRRGTHPPPVRERHPDPLPARQHHPARDGRAHDAPWYLQRAADPDLGGHRRRLRCAQHLQPRQFRARLPRWFGADAGVVHAQRAAGEHYGDRDGPACALRQRGQHLDPAPRPQDGQRCADRAVGADLARIRPRHRHRRRSARDLQDRHVLQGCRRNAGGERLRAESQAVLEGRAPACIAVRAAAGLSTPNTTSIPMAFHSLPDTGTDDPGALIPRRYAWVVFALSFGLLLSDYMSRQVLNAVFPLLKQEWALTDARLGLLSGIVALMVGLLTFPLSLLADRFGRVRSLALMATVWSLATLGCGLAQQYPQMLAARFLVGVGEAAYGSVGIAVVLSVFPKHMRATLTGAFMAGGMFGSVLGMALGGAVAAHMGWRWAFVAMASFGLLLSLLYPLVVREKRIAPPSPAGDEPADERPAAARVPLRSLVDSRSVVGAYVGSGLQLFVGGTVIVWMPSYLNRYFGMATDRAGVTSALIVLVSGLGMIACGLLSDRLCRNSPTRKFSLAIACSVSSCALLSLAFALPHATPQLLLIALGMFLAAGTSGPAGAMVANLTPQPIHGTAFAMLTLVNNMLGLAAGPLVTGMLADRLGLAGAFQLVPLIGLAAAAVFHFARRHYQADIQRLGGAGHAAVVASEATA